jgi:BirA family biotin operon repressor/biotin-[acetyl-CoA-carboxylase] ligase
LPPSVAKTAIGQPFIELTEVESTNIYAMEQLQANMAAHGAGFFAHDQTGGKGQHGKSWVAERGMHIALSVIIDPSFLSIAQQFRLSVAMALGAYDLFTKYAGDETKIKWPNDIYWRDRKAGGILIENQLKGNNWQGSVVGIGINLNQVVFPATLTNPVSLKQITGQNFNTVETAKELCSCLDTRYRQLQGSPFENLLKEYNSHLYKAGEEVKLKKGNIVFPCTVKTVSATGELLVSGGPQESFRFGEITWPVGNNE